MASSVACLVSGKNDTYDLEKLSIYMVESCGPYPNAPCNLMEEYQLILTIIVKEREDPRAELRVSSLFPFQS